MEKLLPHNSEPEEPSYPPQVTPGYPPQDVQPGYPETPAQPPSYSQSTPGYSQQPNTGYPLYPTGGYPPEATKGHPPFQSGYPAESTTGYAPPTVGYPPPQGQGYVQQPGPSHISNHNTTVVITQPSVMTTAVVPPLHDHMGLSIFACLCCCWLIGIFAIIKSSEARNRYITGDYTGALSSAQSARNLSIASIVCGVSIACTIFIIQMVAIANYN